MKKNTGTLIVIILIITNLIFGGILSFIIISIEAPDIVASIEILELNENEILIETEIKVNNSNFFSIIVKDINIICKNIDGLEFGDIKINGGEVAGFSSSTFVNNGSFSFKGYNLETLINEIRGEIGFSFLGFIQKIVPINMKLIVEIKDIIREIKTPEITIKAEISEVLENDIKFIGNVIVYNPNNFEIFLDDILLTVESELNEEVGYISITSGEINPNSYENFSINGNLSYTTLNYDKIDINFEARTGVYIAGFEKIINISTKTEFKIPDIKELLLINDTMDFSLSGEFKLKLNGLLTKVGFKVYNPSNIPLKANDLICYISSYIDNETKPIVQSDMEECTIPSKNEVCIKTELTIPYISLISSGNNKIFPEWFIITIEGNFAIEGTDQYIPISFNGFISPNFFND